MNRPNESDRLYGLGRLGRPNRLDPPNRAPRSRRSRLLAAAGLVLAAALTASPQLAAVPLASAAGTRAAADCPWVGSGAPVGDRVERLLAEMSTAQKIVLLHGNGKAAPYVGNTDAIPDLCIPAMGYQDGPSGVGDGLGGVTQLPSGVASAATWDTALQTAYGRTAGREFAGKGVSVALGPTTNIVRDPRWGRAFESYGEDPYLSARMGVANIGGLQSEGVMAQVKHVAVYNQETHRDTPADNAVVDERTLHEIYLPAFQASVSEGAAASAMCAYSTVNGVHACQNKDLLKEALYEEAGFGGFVTSDWKGTHSTVEAANGGLTVEMPNGHFYADRLARAVADGEVAMDTLDTMVRRVLTPMFSFGLFDRRPSGSPGAVVTSAAHRATARRVAEEGSVLLKNDGGILPLSDSGTGSIAVLGADGGAGVRTAGGGAATVTSSGTVSPFDGIADRAGAGIDVRYDDAGDQAAAVDLARRSDVAVVFAGYSEEEKNDLAGIDLPGRQNALIEQVAAANPNTVVVLHTGSAVTMPWLDDVRGVVEQWYAGQEVGNAIAAVLFGDVNPSGKLPVTFPRSLADVPAHTSAQWPGNGRDAVRYSEGMQVGYRWYDARGIEPLFPFGHGLSYTTFGFSDLRVGAVDGGGNATVTATVTNTGDVAGAEVVQLYAGAPAAAGEPVRQLKGFERVELAPGAGKRVAFRLSARDLAHWDEKAHGWATTAGAYTVEVGDSSRALPLKGTLTVPCTFRPTSPTASPGTGGRTVTITNPHGMSSLLHRAVTLPVRAASTAGPAGSAVTFRATGLPPGLAIGRDGVISGAAAARGTRTVTVTATDRTGAADTATFVWTVS
ncbi:glycoside hydrolase family 3 C-terminal domain-containing protein [Streptomyces sulfonofaciens]|uniref:glycoside hydrolase family 3 C-terminal domain-containing protein n=1 Tax=Streptomyces sulfonofaciens TaxID=68272 RepID=UPI001E641DB7|nr:glycoside hydrolase family 3 C-terminal domain-containing protein [Streptomyces sulfonofaciens]